MDHRYFPDKLDVAAGVPPDNSRLNEYIFVAGCADKHGNRRSCGTSNTLSVLLRSLADDGAHRVTVFDYVAQKRRTVERRAKNDRNQCLASSTEVDLPNGGGNIKGITHLWTYLLSSAVHERSVKAIEYIGHSDYNGLYVKGKYEDYLTEELIIIQDTERDVIRSKLAEYCHIKIWGCGRYYLGDYQSDTQNPDANDPILGKRYIGKNKPVTFNDLVRDNCKAKATCHGGEIKKYAKNLLESAFQKCRVNLPMGGRLGFFWNFTYPAVALSGFLSRPVYAVFWGVGTRPYHTQGNVREPEPGDLKGWGARGKSQHGYTNPKKCEFKYGKNNEKSIKCISNCIAAPVKRPWFTRFNKVFFNLPDEPEPPIFKNYSKYYPKRYYEYDYAKHIQSIKIAAAEKSEGVQNAGQILLYPDIDAYPVDVLDYPGRELSQG